MAKSGLKFGDVWKKRLASIILLLSFNDTFATVEADVSAVTLQQVVHVK